MFGKQNFGYFPILFYPFCFLLIWSLSLGAADVVENARHVTGERMRFLRSYPQIPRGSKRSQQLIMATLFWHFTLHGFSCLWVPSPIHDAAGPPSGKKNTAPWVLLAPMEGNPSAKPARPTSNTHSPPNPSRCPFHALLPHPPPHGSESKSQILL